MVDIHRAQPADFSSERGDIIIILSYIIRIRLVGRVSTLEIVRLHRYTRRPVRELADLQAHLRQRVTFAVRVSPFAVVLHPQRQFPGRPQHFHLQPSSPREPVTAVVVQPRYPHVLVFTYMCVKKKKHV